MALMLRCKICKTFNSSMNNLCTKCGHNIQSSNKSYYSYHRLKGKQKFTYAGHDLELAKQVDARLLLESKASHLPEYQTQAKITVEKFIDRYAIPDFDAKNKSYFKEAFVFDAIIKRFGQCNLHEVTNNDINIYFNQLLKEKAAATANKYLARIKRIFNLAVELEILKVSPVKVKKVKLDNKRNIFLSDDEQVRLLAACKESGTPYLYPMVLIALNTGLRLGEIQSLKRVNIINDQILIKASNTKSGKGRYVPINNKLKKLFADLIGEFDFNHLVRKSFITAKKTAELATDLRFHDLRHTFASNLVKNGVSLYVVQKLLGHASYSMTERYAHLQDEELKNAVGKI